jgi:hypothetical protein
VDEIGQVTAGCKESDEFFEVEWREESGEVYVGVEHTTTGREKEAGCGC